MNTPHTPGPWESKDYDGDTTEIFACDADGTYVGRVNQENPQHEANARLIAAAPDLFDAAYNTLMAFESYEGPGDNELSFLMKAVKKALGHNG